MSTTGCLQVVASKLFKVQITMNHVSTQLLKAVYINRGLVPTIINLKNTLPIVLLIFRLTRYARSLHKTLPVCNTGFARTVLSTSPSQVNPR